MSKFLILCSVMVFASTNYASALDQINQGGPQGPGRPGDNRPGQPQQPQRPQEPQRPQRPQEPQRPQQPQRPQEPQRPQQPQRPQEPQRPGPGPQRPPEPPRWPQEPQRPGPGPQRPPEPPSRPGAQVVFQTVDNYTVQKLVETTNVTRVNAPNVKQVMFTAQNNDVEIVEARITLDDGREIFMDGVTGGLSQNRSIVYTLDGPWGIRIQSITVRAVSRSLIGSRPNLQVAVGIVQ